MLPAKENPCRKFQANIFNKTKCQNCFKPRESHLLSDEDLNQAKPVYGGWLCLAPEGTDFENPMQRSRKWQRRFFLLYEHGGLRYALDELTSTLPQGTINLNQCLEVGEAESRTGQRNSLCIVLPDREFFIRGENREDINGWYEVLTPYPRANKQNQKKKRKVEPPTQLEPGPAKVAVTAASLPSSEKPAETRAPYWQDDGRGRTLKSPVPGSTHNDAPTPEHSSVNGSEVEGKPKNGYCFRDPGRGESLSGLSSPSPGSHGRFAEQRSRINEAATRLDADMVERHGRSERRGQIGHVGIATGSTKACADVTAAAAAASAAPLLRRAKSLDRRTTESLMTPDLLNFKKGWMVKLDADEQWKKHWFVLTDHSLRYYKDSIAEEALDLDGEINLSSCFDVSDVQAQRNYCFQIHTKEGAFTLSAMTAGIRRSWILAIMKNIRPSTNPDISSFVEEKIKPLSTPVSLSSSSISHPETATEPPEPVTEVAICRSRARERRREGRSKTFDWAEFRPIKQAMASRGGPEPQRSSQGLHLEQYVMERGQRWEDRQKWGVDGYEEDVEEERTAEELDGDSRGEEEKMEVGSPDDEIERQWRHVEQMVPRPERQVAIGSVGGTPSSPRAAGFVELLEKEIEALKLQLEQTQQELTSLQSQNSSLNQQLQDALQREQNTRTGYVSQIEDDEQDEGRGRAGGGGRGAVAHSKGVGPRTVSGVRGQLRRVNHELQAELERQRERLELVGMQARTLRQAYTSAREIIAQQEAELAFLKAGGRDKIEGKTKSETGFRDLISGGEQGSIHGATASSEVRQKLTEGEGTKSRSVVECRGHEGARKAEVRPWGHSMSTEARFQGSGKVTGKIKQAKIAEITSQKDEKKEKAVTQKEEDNEKSRNYSGINISRESKDVQFRKSCHGEMLEENSMESLAKLRDEVQRLATELRAEQARSRSLESALTRLGQEATALRMELEQSQYGEWQSSGVQKLMEEPSATMLSNEVSTSIARIEDRTEAEIEKGQQAILVQRTGKQLGELEQALATVLEGLEQAKMHLESLCFKSITDAAVDTGRDAQQVEATLARLMKIMQAASGKHLLGCREWSGRENLNHDLATAKQMTLSTVASGWKAGITSEGLIGEPNSGDGGKTFEPNNRDHKSSASKECNASRPEEATLRRLSEELVAEAVVLARAVCLKNYAQTSVLPSITELQQQISRLAHVPRDQRAAPHDESSSPWAVLGEITSSKVGDGAALTPAMLLHGRLALELLDVEQSVHKTLTLLERQLKTAKATTRALGNALDPICSSDSKAVVMARLKDLEVVLQMEETAEVLDTKESHTDSSDEGTGMRALGQAGAEPISPGDFSPWRRLNAAAWLKDDETDRAANVVVDIPPSSISTESSSSSNTPLLPQLTPEMNNGETAATSRFKQQLCDLTELYEQKVESLQARLEEVEALLSTQDQGHRVEFEISGDMGDAFGSLKRRLHSIETQLADEGEITSCGFLLREVTAVKATCERGFTAMEESHQRVVEDLQRTHQQELEKLRQEKDRLLAEETAATIAAIEAMKNAHREEMEREVDKARKAQSRGGGQDWEELHRHHEQELASVQREIEVLSEQYSQKCLENAHLSQALEAERKALRQCQRENQELNAQNQELNTRMAVELERLRGMGSTRDVERDVHGVYEREVLVRVKESEMQYLKQEMNSLKEELQTALRDKKYATDKYKDVYTELSIVRAKAERDVGRLMDQVQHLTESLGGATQSAISRPGYDIMKSKSNPDILKMACTKRSDRAFRSKSVIDHPADFAS